MNIKSLLLGSAAAFAAVSSAQAADAIVAAAPEPMEYVKVCDAFGTGYFYIPGTETCLKIEGIVRMDVNFVPKSGAVAGHTEWNSKERLHIYANNDSEYGTVYSFIRLEGNQSNSTSASAVNAYYYAGIGGFEFGNFDNQWAKFFGYGVDASDYGGGYVNWSDANRNYLSYSATFGAAKAFVALEDDASGNWAPDVSGGVIGTFGDFTGGLGLGYDESLKSLAVLGLARAKVDMFSFAVQAFYAHVSAADAAAGRGNVYFPTIGSDAVYYTQNAFSVLAGVSVAATDAVSLNLDGQYWNDKSYFINGNVTWNVAPGFQTMLEGGFGQNKANGGNSDVRKLFVRFERSF